jgi:hypothetical protein
MKKTNDNSNSSDGSDVNNTGSESNANQENGEGENGTSHFYLLMGDENNDLGEAIRHWETINHQK